MTKQIDKNLTREINIADFKRADEGKRTIEVAFSSEEVVERYFGDEVLDHNPQSVRLDRLNNGGAVLVEHDRNDQVGVVESARIDSDRVGRATLRFSKSKRGKEIYQDVLDGIRTLISVGYSVSKWDETREGDKTKLRATDWMPYEISFVSIPADASVGVGRSNKQEQEIKMTDVKKEVEVQAERKVEASQINVRELQDKTRRQELDRINSIRQMAEQHDFDKLGADAIERGTDSNAFYKELLEKVGERNAAVRAKQETETGEAAGKVGLSSKEKSQFSMVRLMDAMANPNDRSAQNAAGFELEVCAEAERTLPGDFKVRGSFIPTEVFNRDLTAGTSTDGAELVATNLLSGSYIDVLRNNMVALQAGATMLPGLVGNVAIPRQTSGAAATWISAEDGDATESEPQFDQITLSPKDLAAYTEVSRRLSLQSSPAIEGIVRNDLFMALALGMDAAVYYGSGSSGQPQGIDGATGVADPTFSTATAPTYAELVTQMKTLMTSNAANNLTYIGSPDFWETVKTTPKQGSGVEGNFISDGNSILGRNLLTSSQLAADDFVLGDFSNILIGEWGGIELNTDPYTHSLKGKTRYVIFKTCDIAIRHPQAFSFHNAA